MMPGKGLEQRRARCALLVTAQPCTEDAGRRVTVIKSLTTSMPWGSCEQALVSACLLSSLNQERGEAPMCKAAVGKLAGLLGGVRVSTIQENSLKCELMVKHGDGWIGMW